MKDTAEKNSPKGGKVVGNSSNGIQSIEPTPFHPALDLCSKPRTLQEAASATTSSCQVSLIEFQDDQINGMQYKVEVANQTCQNDWLSTPQLSSSGSWKRDLAEYLGQNNTLEPRLHRLQKKHCARISDDDQEYEEDDTDTEDDDRSVDGGGTSCTESLTDNSESSIEMRSLQGTDSATECRIQQLKYQMDQSCATQDALLDWDRANGCSVPPSYSITMKLSNQSRRQLQESKILRAQQNNEEDGSRTVEEDSTNDTVERPS